MASLIPYVTIKMRILFIRHGQEIMYDTDVAIICGVNVKRLNVQIRHNRNNFPEDFMVSSSFPNAYNEHGEFAACKCIAQQSGNEITRRQTLRRHLVLTLCIERGWDFKI